MQTNMGKFSEKLVELLELAKEEKELYWNTRRSMTSLKTSHWELNTEKVFDFLEASGVDVMNYRWQRR